MRISYYQNGIRIIYFPIPINSSSPLLTLSHLFLAAINH